MNGRLLKKEQQQHAEWLSKQPPAVERRAYTRPAGILRRDDQVFNDTTNAFDGGVNIPIECNHDERTPTEVSRAHDTKNNALLNDATATGRNSANTTSVGKLCSATCTGGDSGCFDLWYLSQLDESSAADSQFARTVPAYQLDESRDGGNRRIDRNGSQLEFLDHPFFFALKAVDATGTDNPSTPPPIDTSDSEHIARDISLVDYAQDFGFLLDLTE